MKIAITAAVAAVVAGALSTPAFAWEAKGNVSAGRTIVIAVPVSPATHWLLLNAPTYTLIYCVGPRANPCGRGGHTVTVQGGHTEWGGPNDPGSNVLAVRNPNRVTAPYAVLAF
jgi:hypothetical protein